MRPWAVWAIGITLLVAAWGVTKVTPGPEFTEASFVTEARLGERAVGSELIVTVDDVVLVTTASDRRGWTAEGDWLVVDLALSAKTSEERALLGTATLEADGRTYRASERPESLLSEPLGAGITTTGSLAFEVPEEVTGSEATIRFASKAGDVRLDSVIEMTLDLAELPREDARELRPTVGGGL